MALVLELKPEVETRLQTEAEARRLSVEEYVESLLPVDVDACTTKFGSDQEYQSLLEIAQHCQSLPTLDSRSTDEIIGYDENGLPS